MTIQEWLGEENQLGIDIWHKKYQYEYETLDQWFERVSGGNKDIEKLIREKKFLFGGRILSSRGLDKLGRKISLSNCYVLPAPEDELDSIFEVALQAATTYSRGGGVGLDLSKLAPRGAKINNVAKETSGAASFMELYSCVTGLIGQNGRRGALMLSLDCNHPDLEEFIEAKYDLEKVTKANISVRITDDFMVAVITDEEYCLHFVRETTGEVIEKVVRAREVFQKIAESNWDIAKPGALFWDRIAKWNMLSEYANFEYAGVNPCAS